MLALENTDEGEIQTEREIEDRLEELEFGPTFPRGWFPTIKPKPHKRRWQSHCGRPWTWTTTATA